MHLNCHQQNTCQPFNIPRFLPQRRSHITVILLVINTFVAASLLTYSRQKSYLSQFQMGILLTCAAPAVSVYSSLPWTLRLQISTQCMPSLKLPFLLLLISQNVFQVCAHLFISTTPGHHHLWLGLLVSTYTCVLPMHSLPSILLKSTLCHFHVIYWAYLPYGNWNKIQTLYHELHSQYDLAF